MRMCGAARPRRPRHVRPAHGLARGPARARALGAVALALLLAVPLLSSVSSAARGVGPSPPLAGPGLPGHAKGAAATAVAAASRPAPSPANPVAAAGAPLPAIWTNVTPSATASPPSTQSGGMVYDPLSSEYVLFGGVDSSGAATNETWTFANGSWTDLTASLATSPAARWYFAFVWDAADGYALLFGGRNATTDFNDTWAFNATGWHELTLAVAPPPLTGGRVAYDARDGYVLLYGGYSILPGAPSTYNFTWSFSGGLWTNRTASVKGPPPDPHVVTYAAYDATDGYVLLYGGSTGTTNASCGTSGNTWTYANGTYRNLTGSLAGAPPVGLGSRMMADDVAVGGVVLYGGWDGGGCPFSNQTWVYRGGAWYNASLAVSPGPLWDGEIASEPGNGSLLLFGGNTAPYTTYQSDETWSLLPGVRVSISANTTQGLQPLAVNFTSAVQGIGPFGYAWSFGDGSAPSSSPNTTHTFVSAGSYSVVLRVTPSLGAIGSGAMTVSVYLTLAASPTASATDGDAPLPVAFLSHVVGGVPPIRSAWSFGDGGTATTADPTHTYGTAGLFRWQFTATDSLGDTSVGNGTIAVAPPIVLGNLSLNRTHGTAPMSVAFAASISGGAPPYRYVWTFGDGAVSAQGNATGHVYTAPGTYSGNLSVADAFGGALLAPFTVVVAPPVSVSEGGPAAYSIAPLVAQFSAAATGGFPPYSYSWDLGLAGATGTGPTVSQEYPAGHYLVTVVATDAEGDATTASWAFTVVAPLSISLNATAPAALAHEAVTFSLSSSGGLGPYAYSWNFGDGSTSTAGANSSHAYAQAGSYRVSVTERDSLGELEAAAVSVEIVAPLTVGVATNVTTVTIGQTVEITAASIGGLSPLAVSWSGLPGGCPVSPHTLDVTCRPVATGTYQITAWLNDSLGEHASANTTLFVIEPPSAATGGSVGPVPLIDLELAGVVAVVVLVEAWILSARRRRKTRLVEPDLPADADPGAPPDG